MVTATENRDLWNIYTASDRHMGVYSVKVSRLGRGWMAE